jgi:hypothetical protein
VKIYVASKFENSKAVREAHRALEEDGHEITHDWTNENADGLEGEAKEEYLKKCASKDVVGVLSGQGILVLNHERMAGGFTEFGIAIGSHWLGRYMCIVVIDGHHEEKPRNIFFHLPFIWHVRNLKEARMVFKQYEEWCSHLPSAPFKPELSHGN